MKCSLPSDLSLVDVDLLLAVRDPEVLGDVGGRALERGLHVVVALLVDVVVAVTRSKEIKHTFFMPLKWEVRMLPSVSNWSSNPTKSIANEHPGT